MIIEYQRRTHFPTYTGNARFRVDDEGGVFAQVNREEPPLNREWCADYPAAPTATLSNPRATIDAILTRHEFFSMEPRTVDDEYDGGYWEQLTYWNAEGAAREVLVDRAQVPAFRALVNALTSSLELLDLHV